MVMFIACCICVGPFALCDFYRKNTFLIRKSKFFLAKKRFSSKQKWRFPPFKMQDIIWMGLLTWHTVNSALSVIYDKLNKFIDRLTYCIWRFIFFSMAQTEGRSFRSQCPLLFGPWMYYASGYIILQYKYYTTDIPVR